MSIRVFIYAREEQIRVLRQMISRSDEIMEVGGTANENQVLDGIRATKADVMLTYMDGGPAVYRTVQQIYMLCPQCIALALAPKQVMDTETSRIIQCGIHYLYEDSISEDDLVQNIKNAYSVEQNRKESLEDGRGSQLSAKVFTFYGPKDGMGKTTFLFNYAVELARHRKKVVILDLDLQFGDVHILANIEPKETLAEMLQERNDPPVDVIRQYLRIHKSGVNILCAPRNIEYADKISGAQVEKLISALRNAFDYVLIDTGSAFDDIAYVCCDQAARIFMAVRPDISALNHVKKVLRLLEALNQKEKVGLLYYEVQKKGDIDPSNTVKVLGAPILYTIPYDVKTAVEAMNRGEPAVQIAPRSALAKAVRDSVQMTLTPPKFNTKEKRKKR